MGALRLHRQEFRAMGSPCEVQAFARSREQAEDAIGRIVAEAERLEARYSRYRADSFLSAINQAASRGAAIEVDAETGRLLDYAEACFVQSDGLFDISSGVLGQAWKFAEGGAPDPARIEALLPRVGWGMVNWAAPVLAFPVAGMELDFGGVVKEYAADRAAALCRDAGLAHCMINLGGDIRVTGARGEGAPWRIGIRHPRNKEAMVRTLEMSQGALASSGDYERCIEVAGVRYGHILNPRTGWPVRRLAAVSVVAEHCVLAGSAATIAMLKEADGPRWLEQSGLDHLWIGVDGETGGSL